MRSQHHGLNENGSRLATRAASRHRRAAGAQRVHAGFDPELLEELVRAVESWRC